MNTFKKGDVVDGRGTVSYIDGPYVYFTNGIVASHEYCTLVPQPKFKPGDVVKHNNVPEAGEGVVLDAKNYDGWYSIKWNSHYGECVDPERSLTLVRSNNHHFGFAAAVAAPKATPKFKVGDRVVTKGHPELVGIILKQATPNQWQVDFNPSWYGICTESESYMTLAPPIAPTIVIRRDPGKGYRPNDNPRVHNSVAEATKEAERLAKANPGVEFATFSLASTSTATAPTVTTVVA